MPFSKQSDFHHLSPEFIIECKRLRAKGMNYKEIADAINIKEKAIARYFQIIPELKDCNKRLRREASANPRKFRGTRLAFRTEVWRREDFEAFVERMRKQQRGLYEVCEDPDMPAYIAMNKYIKKHPEFEDKVRQAYSGMPYSEQIRHQRPLQRFFKDLLRLRSRGMTLKEIGEALGVKTKTVQHYLKKIAVKNDLKK